MRTVGTFPPADRSSVEKIDDLEVPLSDFATDAVLGFADFSPDSDSSFRRMALVKRWDGRVVTHQSLAVIAVHLGVKLSDIRLNNGTIRIDSEHVVPNDVSGQLSINWPTNGEEGTFEALSQLSLGDLLELAKYDSDLMKTRHNL